MRTLLVGLRVADLERSLTFYAALGYVELGRVATADGAALVPLSLPDDPAATLELVHRPHGGQVVPGGLDHLAIQVDDLDHVIEHLASRGIAAGPVELPGGPEGPRTARLRDPDGYPLELVQWPAGHHWGMTRADFA